MSIEGQPDPCPWVRLVLPLKIEARHLAICLLGRKDPDDLYSADEIVLLQALMDQTALALVHLEHAERLRLLFQMDIQRQEDERSRLARELHDELLGQMALIIQNVSTHQDQQAFLQVYQPAVQEIRSIIADLRPAMLNYGLKAALEELVENPADLRIDGNAPINTSCILEGGLTRYPEYVELHLYRIVQQAWRNAIQHAKPASMMLHGRLDDQCVALEVIDDGTGFDTPHTPDLGVLLTRQQYGLVGMVERAALIQAELMIDSAPGQGTRVKVSWKGMTPGQPDQSTRTMSSG
jgi:signal transduction histidine kinase